MSAAVLTLPPVAFHVEYTFERPTGYAAKCDTCGAVTPGNADTRREALDALMHLVDIRA